MERSAIPKVKRQKQRALRKNAAGHGKGVRIQSSTETSTGEDTSETIVKDTPPEQRLLRKRKSDDLSTRTGVDEHQSIKKRKQCNKDSQLKKVSTSASTSENKGVLDVFLDAETGESSGDEFKPKNLFGMIDIQEGLTYYRCNLKTAFRDLHSLPFKPNHISVIKKTPFWVLFNSIMSSDSKKMRRRCTKYEEDIRTVMKRFDTRTNKFIIGGEFWDITKVDIQLILGVTGGAKKIPLIDRNYALPDWVTRCFGAAVVTNKKSKKKEMYKCLILRTLREVVLVNTTEGYKDTARLVHCYLLAMFLAPNRNGSINWHVSCFCQNLEKLYTYDWCGFILDQLMTQLQRTQNLMSGGCVLLLLYWLCEHTRLVQPYEDMAIPRYLRWDLEELNVTLRKEHLSSLKKQRLRAEVQKPTKMEKDTYRALKIIWDKELRRARDMEKERDDSEKKRGVGQLHSLPREKTRVGDRDAIQNLSFASTDESAHGLTGSRGQCRLPVTARDNSKQNLQGSNRETTESAASQGDSRDAVRTVSESKNCAFDTNGSSNQSTEGKFRTPDSRRWTRSRALEYRGSPNPDTTLVCLPASHHRGECSRANLNKTSTFLQEEIGFIGTYGTKENGGLKTTETSYEAQERDKKKIAATTTKVDTGDNREGVGRVTSLVVPEGPSFNLGFPETQNIHGHKAKSEINRLLQDINSSLGLDQICEPEFISRNATATVEVNLSDTQIGQMEGSTLDTNKDRDSERMIPEELMKLRSDLADRDKQIEAFKEKLQIQTNKMSALIKKNEKDVQRSVEKAVAENTLMHISVFDTSMQVMVCKLRTLESEIERLRIFESLNSVQAKEIEKLKSEKEQLVEQLSQHLDPTNTQFWQNETTLQLITAIEEREIFKSGYEALESKECNVSGGIEEREGVSHPSPKKQSCAFREPLPPTGPVENQILNSVEKEEFDKQGIEEVFKPVGGSCILSDKRLESNRCSELSHGIETIKTNSGKENIGDLKIDENTIDASMCVPDIDIVVGECTPKDPFCKKRLSLSLNTMIRKVKSRTLNEDRKKICNETDEAKKKIGADSYEISDDTDDDDNSVEVDCIVPLNTKKATVRQLKPETRERLQARWSKGQKRAVVWRGTPEFGSYVSMQDILLVLHDDRLSNSVVDCWGELLLTKYESTKDTMVFVALAWDYIKAFNGTDRSKSLFNVVDKRIEKGVDKDHVLLFPMLTKGNGRHEQGDHWTLLEFNLSECEWRFFNSIEPRSKKVQDIHYTRALVLVNYVERKIRDVFKIKFPDHPIHKITIQAPFPIYGPQQVHGSLDCGVVVCSNIENLISRTEIPKDKFKHEEASKYRGKMVEWFFSERKNKIN